MKKIVLLLIGTILIAGSFVFTSCSKSESSVLDQPPTINFVAKQGYVSGDVTLTIGDMFKVNVTAFPNAVSGSKLARLVITRVTLNTPFTVKDTSFSLTSLNLDLTAFAQNVVGQEKWIFKITDKANQSAEASFTITTIATAGPINSFSMKILGAQGSATGSSFASIDGTVYILSDAKANQSKIDWLYYYGASDLATIAAPDDAHAATVFTNATYGLQTWTTKNATRFKLVTTAISWDNITDDEVIVAQTASGVTNSRITSLTAGQYLSFIAASGKKGMIKVESITTGDTGDITISVKVQQ